jgi:hypothetical protein
MGVCPTLKWIDHKIYVMQDAQKGRPARPQTKQEPEAYPQGYVEDSCKSRTPLATFFSILLALLGRVGHKRRIELLHLAAAALRAGHLIGFMLLQG